MICRNQLHALVSKGPGLRIIYKLDVSFFAMLAALQLIAMLATRRTYIYYRHHVALMHRLLRIVFLANSLYRVTPDQYYNIIIKHWMAPGASTSWSLIQSQTWVALVTFHSTVNYPLRTQQLLPTQLVLVIICLASTCKVVCAVSDKPSLLEAGASNCQAVQAVLYGIAGNLPSSAVGVLGRVDHSICRGRSGIWLIQAFVNLVIVFFLPAIIIYLLEQQAKHRYLERRGLAAKWALEEAPWSQSPPLQAIICLVLLSVVWQVLEMVYLFTKPCSAC
jgi:hypothetical protein